MEIVWNENAFVLGLNKCMQIRQLRIIYLTLSKKYIDINEKQFVGINKWKDLTYLKETKIHLFEFERVKK